MNNRKKIWLLFLLSFCSITLGVAQLSSPCDPPPPADFPPSPPPAPPPGSGSGKIPFVAGFDPNQIVPPNSLGEEGWIRRDQFLPFMVTFENDPEQATAPAQRVEITVPFDGVVVDLNSVELSDFGFGSFYFEVPFGVNYYKDTLDTAVELGVNVEVEMGVDLAQSRAYWYFQSLDPLTNEPPTDPFTGFLPVNDPEIHNGEGFFYFSFNPTPISQTFDEIHTYADIIFDFNPAIMTDIALNTIDADAPISTVLPTVTAPSPTQLRIFWEGTDIGCGLANYTIFVSEDGGRYFPWMISTDTTSAFLPAKMGSTYRLFSIARDSVGNAEKKNDFDIEVTFTEDLLEGPRVAAKVFLQGTYNMTIGKMDDHLRSLSLIPLREPYTDLGYTQVTGGGEEISEDILDKKGDNSIVDWVFVQLRDKNDPTIVLGTRCALVQRDGDVVDVDGESAINFRGLVDDDYYVAVLHRNHLGVCAGAPVSLSNTPAEINFTSPATSTYGANAQVNAFGTMLMWGGDANFDGKIVYAGVDTDANDISADVLLNPFNSQNSALFLSEGYLAVDLNMDGKVIYDGTGADVDIISQAVLQNPLNVEASPTLVLLAQLPQ